MREICRYCEGPFDPKTFKHEDASQDDHWPELDRELTDDEKDEIGW